jgi:hypothetical protein
MENATLPASFTLGHELNVSPCIKHKTSGLKVVADNQAVLRPPQARIYCASAISHRPRRRERANASGQSQQE